MKNQQENTTAHEETINKSPRVRLLADRVLVKVLKKEEVTTSTGIILPSTKSEDQAETCLVLSVSKRVEECTVEEDKVYVGDLILVSGFAGTPISYSGEDYRVLRITDIFCALEKEQPN